ncbi:class II aldolase/adducin family protein [Candidatus Pacearchaeota archaeon]|nr:class II aldolase/adducin family protein [Candidatus Pacearchaeota archaeon]MBI2057255.1 class II aldolase/adducin family protein [Candidatus Pacearchaeota archaeon]
MDEGYIKFNCEWIKDKPCLINKLVEINKWRDKLYTLGFIGAYDNGIGFGNLSIRFKKNNFIITGSATGNLHTLNETHYVLVNKYDFTKNSLTCKGPIKASSESLSHAMIYECSSDANAVLHIHNIDMWERFIDKLPTTNKDISYGTPAMAKEIKRLFIESNVNDEKIFVMGGHKEGIISFGKTLNEAGNILLSKFRML